MGGGSWTNEAYYIHSTAARGFKSMDDFYKADVQQLYHAHSLDPALDPKGVIRESCDSEEHPNSIPVILGLDVTGSMGSAATAIAHQLNDIMTEIYKTTKDVQFMIMAIGDLACDSYPLQVSQFESDIRIAEQLEKVYFEGGGGGNKYESYTQAWFFGLNQTELDCWKRGKKGIIITIGDEPLNPYLPAGPLARVTGQNIQGDIETKDLYEEALKKFDIYHIGIDDRRTSFKGYRSMIEDTWGELLKQNLIVCNCNQLSTVIADIVKNSEQDFPFIVEDEEAGEVKVTENGISW